VFHGGNIVKIWFKNTRQKMNTESTEGEKKGLQRKAEDFLGDGPKSGKDLLHPLLRNRRGGFSSFCQPAVP
jgi:hypothetical protein